MTPASASKNVANEQAQVRAGRRLVNISRPGKVLFPDDGITKLELAEYYAAVASAMVPLVRERPIAMERFPDGLGGQRFYQKDLKSSAPEWVHREVVQKKGGQLTQLLCDNAETLVYMADQATITPHIWLSRIDRPDCPDQLIFDLDPPGYDAFTEAQRVALAVRAMLAELGLSAVAKTTGGKGIHVMVPLDRRATYPVVRDFANTAAALLQRRDPERLTAEFRKEKRDGRLFLDVTRNAYAQHIVGPFGVRARPGAPVATPLHWSEVEDPSVRPEQFSLRSVPGRVASNQQPWGPLRGQSLTKPARILADLVGEDSEGVKR
ncbi:MAG TPA: non-homologous end-joining DNA ligase [Actinomycetota bacterium]|nr:non-homologous end-joining DNA ligase [Actinomycetota bacterium]